MSLIKIEVVSCSRSLDDDRGRIELSQNAVEYDAELGVRVASSRIFAFDNGTNLAFIPGANADAPGISK